MKREELFAYVKEAYGTEAEYLWSRDPDSAVLRRKENGKWYGVVMRVQEKKLGMAGEREVDVLNVKCDPDTISAVVQTSGFFPGYHMNKEHWLSILLDGAVDESQILDFIDRSYVLTGGRRR